MQILSAMEIQQIAGEICTTTLSLYPPDDALRGTTRSDIPAGIAYGINRKSAFIGN